MALPVLFAAARTLGDICNSLVMLCIYTGSGFTTDQRLTYNSVTTGISTVSAFVLAAASLLVSCGVALPVVTAIADVDTTYTGYMLIAVFIGIAGVAMLTAG